MSSGTGAGKRPRGLLADSAVRLVREKPLGTVGAAITLVFLLMAVFADVLAPYGMNEGTPTNLTPPSAVRLKQALRLWKNSQNPHLY